MYPTLSSGRERAPIMALTPENLTIRSLRLRHLEKSVFVGKSYAFRVYHRTRYYTLRIEGKIENIEDYTVGGQRYQSVWVRVTRASVENQQSSRQQIKLPQPGELFEIPVSVDILSAQEV